MTVFCVVHDCTFVWFVNVRHVEKTTYMFCTGPEIGWEGHLKISG